MMDPVAQYWTKIVIGVLVFLVWVGSVTVLPGATTTLLVIAPTLSSALFVIAGGFLGWGAVQGATAVKSNYLATGPKN
jgi:hypothetical protein